LLYVKYTLQLYLPTCLKGRFSNKSGISHFPLGFLPQPVQEVNPVAICGTGFYGADIIPITKPPMAKQ